MGKTIIRAATCFLILCVIISGIIPAMAAEILLHGVSYPGRI